MPISRSIPAGETYIPQKYRPPSAVGVPEVVGVPSSSRRFPADEEVSDGGSVPGGQDHGVQGDRRAVGEDDTVLGETVEIAVDGDATLLDLIDRADVEQRDTVIAGELSVGPYGSFFRPTL